MINPKCLFSKRIWDYKVPIYSGQSRRYINLDNAATTPPLAVVELAVDDFFSTYGSVHRGSGTKSIISTKHFDQARETIKDRVNAPNNSYLIFASNTTGAINTLAHFFSFLPGKIALSAIEHSSSYLPWILSEGQRAFNNKNGRKELSQVTREVLNLGQNQIVKYEIDSQLEICLKSVEELLNNEKPKALVLTATSNLNGASADIRAIGNLAHKFGAYFIVDACQAIAHRKIDMQKLGIDFLVASGHKFYAPYGSGFLIGPKTFFDEFLPYQIGGGNLKYISSEGELFWDRKEQLNDPGTPNAVGAVAMAVALEELHRVGLTEIEAYESELTYSCFDLLKKIPNIRFYSNPKDSHTIVTFEVDNLDNSFVTNQLNNLHGIGLRTGSFCTYAAVRRLKSVLDDRDIVATLHQGSAAAIPGVIRASIGLSNTMEDIEIFGQSLAEIVERGLTSSPIYQKTANIR